MSILINKDTKVITQGITGKTGQFHTRMCREYGNGKEAFVAGVNPKRAGEDFEGIPIYASVKEAKEKPVLLFPLFMFHQQVLQQLSGKPPRPIWIWQFALPKVFLSVTCLSFATACALRTRKPSCWALTVLA